MFKNAILKQVVAICICLVSVVCSYGQGGGIIDVVTRQKSAKIYELSLNVHSGNEIKVSLITSDGTVYLQKTVSDGVITDSLPSGTYRLVAEEQIGRSQSYFLRLED